MKLIAIMLLLPVFLQTTAFCQSPEAPPKDAAGQSGVSSSPSPAPSPEATPVDGDSPGKQVVDGKGGYVYLLPEGWTVQDVRGPTSKVAFGSKEDGNPANIAVNVVKTRSALDEYAGNFLKALRKNFEDRNYSDIEVVPVVKFETSAGQNGVRFALQAVQKDGKIVREVCYVFERKDGAKIGMICTAVGRGDAYDAAFDAIMKTLQITK